jgi:membrane protease YdiL (CAAX protease family)
VTISVIQAIAHPKALSRKLEFGVLFFLLPAMVALGLPEVPFWIGLPLMGALCTTVLMLDDRFDRTVLWNTAGFKRGLLPVLGLWLFGVVVLAGIVRYLAPEKWLDLPTQAPGVWLTIMIAYPLLSVYLQNIIYRAFIFHRYRNAFRTPDHMIWASALAFCFAHVIFHNWIALTLTMAGGLIFAYTYHKNRSLLLCSLEHALYGCTLFTIGLGSYLFHGTHVPGMP